MHLDVCIHADENVNPDSCERQLRWTAFKGSGEGTGCWLRLTIDSKRAHCGGGGDL